MSLQLKNIKKSFKDTNVINDVTLSVESGETLVLFGPSGAGKTVLLRLIAGVIEPDFGEIWINGQNITGVEPEERGIGMAFQNFALFPHMDAAENIAAPLIARGRSNTDVVSTVKKIAKLLKIEHVLHHKPKELSNGQKQRTSLARALSAEPSVLLLDDPLRNVDAKLRFEMRLELPRLLKNQNATVIYVTQDYKEAMALGRRIAVMNNHGIQQLGTPEDIYLRPANLEIARLFGDPIINLVNVRPESGLNGITVHISGKPITLTGFDAAIGSECILGLRPEALQFVEQNTIGAFPVKIETETPLNEKIVTLATTLSGEEIMISRPANMCGAVNGRAWLSITASNALLFDKITGNLLKRNLMGVAA